MKQPLYGHTSQETAYLVEDYPYGFRLRCRMRHWIEHKPKHGYRWVTQTSNPKCEGIVWNKPKGGTYAKIGACLYLDAEGHVQCERLTEYDDGAKVLAFMEAFPGAVDERLRHWARAKLDYYTKRLPLAQKAGKDVEYVERELRVWCDAARLAEGLST